MTTSGADDPTAAHGGSPSVGSTGDRRSFFSLVAVIFQGALSDNIFRYLLLMLVLQLANQEVLRALGDGADPLTLKTEQTKLANTYQQYVQGSFLIPYLLVPSLAGWLSDRFSKARVVLWTKIMEIVVMSLALVTLGLGPTVIPGAYIWVSVGVLFLMGIQSALFSPARYGVVPELLPAAKLGWANGIVQTNIFAAIVIGTILGPLMFGFFEANLWVPAVILIVLACLGTWLASLMNQPPAASPGLPLQVNPFPLLIKYGAEIARHGVLLKCLVGLVVFWMAGFMILDATTLLLTNILQLKPETVGFALLPVVLAQGVGCAIAGALSSKRIELRLIPVGAIGVFLASVLVYAIVPVGEAALAAGDAGSNLWWLVPCSIAIVGFFCGFFIVPLEAWFVDRTDPHLRGGVWSVSNVATILGMLAGIAIKTQVVAIRSSPGDVFIAIGALMLLAGLYLAPMCLRGEKT